MQRHMEPNQIVLRCQACGVEEALPLPAAAQPVSLGKMRTPLLPVEDRASRVHLKLDFLFPTEIKQAVLAWARRGILMEPKSATALAASTALGSNHLFGSSATAVVPITGSGVKSAQRILI